MYRIWQYMSELVQTKEGSAPAIIISAHYIEEAKFCDVVCLINCSSYKQFEA